MIIVNGYLIILVASQDQALDAMKTLITATRAEDGCIRYAFARDLVDPEIVHVTEAWESAAALKAHGQAPHMAEFGKVAATLGIMERDIKMHEAGDGIPL